MNTINKELEKEGKTNELVTINNELRAQNE
jgi:hypothetical protein